MRIAREQLVEFICQECGCRFLMELPESQERDRYCPNCATPTDSNCVVEVENVRRITEPRYT